MSIIEESEYKGNKMIILKSRPDSSYPFQFGREKAKLIMDSIPAIKHFAETGEVICDVATQTAPQPTGEGDAPTTNAPGL